MPTVRFIWCPNNFSQASRKPIVGVPVGLILRISDTSPYSPRGVAVQSDLDFMGWIRIGIEKDAIAQRLRTEGTLRGMIESINREFYWAGGGDFVVKALYPTRNN